mgnify:CR=1 FL=1
MPPPKSHKKISKAEMGRHDQLQLAKLYELRGVTPEQAAQEGLNLYIQKAMKDLFETNKALDEALAQARAATLRRSEYQE